MISADLGDKQRFARALTQDYVSLLRSSRQLSAYVREDILREDPDAAMHALGMLDLRLAGMDRFVKDLIRYCNAGDRVVTPEQFSLTELCELVFRKQNVHPEARIEFALTQDQVVVDLTVMRSVLDQLFRNAIAHHDNPSTLRISVESSQAVGAGVIISVRDNGPGVPTPMLTKIAQPFFRIATGGKSAGLGLAIAAAELASINAELQFRPSTGGLNALIVLPEEAVSSVDSRRPEIEPLDSSTPRLRIV